MLPPKRYPEPLQLQMHQFSRSICPITPWAPHQTICPRSPSLWEASDSPDLSPLWLLASSMDLETRRRKGMRRRIFPLWSGHQVTKDQWMVGLTKKSTFFNIFKSFRRKNWSCWSKALQINQSRFLWLHHPIRWLYGQNLLSGEKLYKHKLVCTQNYFFLACLLLWIRNVDSESVEAEISSRCDH